MAKIHVADSILNAIEIIVQKYTAGLQNNFIKSAIKSVTTKGQYVVVLNGSEYVVSSGVGIQFSAGDLVWVHVPNGNYSDAYISATITPKSVNPSVVSSAKASAIHRQK